VVMNRSRLSAALITIALCGSYASKTEAAEPAFNPIPGIAKIPSNPSVTWLSQVFESPTKYGLDEWVPVRSSLSDTSGLIAYSVDFSSSYPIDKGRLLASMPKLKVKWINPRVEQSLSLELWKEDVDGVLKKESPWITPGRLTWTLVNFVYECAVPGRIYRIDLTRIDARSHKRLEYRLDNEMLTMDYDDSWPRVCKVEHATSPGS
jgi:hypothetical protein